MPYVYSTATAGDSYVKYKYSADGKSLPIAVKTVTIRGGHGVSDKNFVTPRGVVTEVSQEDLDFLLSDPNFMEHVKAGFMSYDKKKVDPEKKIKNMAKKDGSAPLTPADFEEGKMEDSKIYKGIPQGKPR